MQPWTPNADTVRLLLRRFDLPYRTGVLTPGARGSMGQVWRFDLAEPTSARPEDPRAAPGDRLMVKQFFWGAPPTAESDARREAELCRRAEAAGLRITRSLAARDGSYVQRLPPEPREPGSPEPEPEEEQEIVVRLNTWARGRPVRDRDPGRAEYLGHTLGTLHAIAASTDTQPDAYATIPPSPADWTALLERVAAQPDRVPRLARALPTGVPDLIRLGDLVDTAPQRDLIIGHRDVRPANVLRDESTGEQTLIDWDEAGPISPTRELASQLYVWHVRDGIVDTEGVRRTMRAYRLAGGTGEPTSRAAFGQRLANDLNYIHGEVDAALADDLPEQMRRYAEREAESYLAAAPEPATLDALLAAAA